MSATAPADIDALVAPLRAEPARSAILCDVDGTLAPIVDDPSAAAVPEETRSLLRALADRYALVGCLTGRRVEDALRIVGVPELHYAGNHGFELREPDGEVRQDPVVADRAGRARAFLAEVEAELRDAGLRLEDKGPIQAIHWRGASDDAQREAQRVAELARERGLVPRWGRKVLEIRPVAGIDKGAAAHRMLRQSGAAHALFGGDDLTDLDAFQALGWMRKAGRLDTAVCVGVDSEEAPEGIRERADLMVEGPEGFAGVLKALLGG